jgi:hypothetical protein
MSIPISILSPGGGDFSTIAALEAHVFNDDPISVHAFGPSRNSPAALQERAVSLAAPPNGYSVCMHKAVVDDEKIVGFALWKLYENNDQLPLEDQNGLPAQDQLQVNGTGTKKEIANENKWPEGANIELCQAAFGRSDELCKLAMRGKKYAGAYIHFSVYSPSFTKRPKGINTWQIHNLFHIRFLIALFYP